MKKYELMPDDENIKETINEDLLGRNKKLINLMKLLNNINENFLLSIDGEWGTGKTFFVKQLKYICENAENIEYIQKHKDYDKILNFSNRYLPIYYNAWENDNHGDPLESIIYNILDQYPRYKKEIENPKGLFSSIKPILLNIIDKGSFGIISKECFEQLNSFEELSRNIFTVEETIGAVNELFNKILNDDCRLLLIIDELDRCRPDYAVKMLETLKHFYNNQRLTIIVVTNNKQLSYTIRKYYGNEFDGYGYLNKIYDTVITLETENLDNYLKRHCQIINSTYLPEDMSALLFNFLHFSYRECNKYMSMYRIVEPYTKYQDDFDRKRYLFEADVLLPMALALKIKNIEEYNRFIKGESEEFIKKILNSIQYIENDNKFEHWFKEVLDVKNDETLEEVFIRRYKSLFVGVSRGDGFPYLEAISMLGNSINFFEEQE